MICIINCGTTFLDSIKNNLAELGCPYQVIDLGEIEGRNFESFSGIIISGSPTLLTQVDLKKYLKPFKFVKVAEVPVLGICLGHQIIGLLYGSKIHHGTKVDKKENIEVVMKDALFANLKDCSLFQEEHSEYITLPEEFSLIAKSRSCDNEAMKHKEKNIHGVQFHPEVSGDNGKVILKNFVNMCRGPG